MPEKPIPKEEQTSAPRGCGLKRKISRNMGTQKGARAATECSMAEKDDHTHPNVESAC